MIEEAERLGLLKPGGTIVEASSGNQGIALAMIGAVKGYNVIVTASEKISEEKFATMRAYGAEVVLCHSTELIDDPKSYHSRAVEIQKKTPNSFMPNQYFNLSNSKAHYALLGPEVWRQTEGRITHFIAAAGTSGTISGAGKFLKEENSNIKIIAVDAATSYHATRGHPKSYKMEGIGLDFDTPIFDDKAIEEIIPVTDEEGLGMLKTMARKHGFLVGPSSGAVAFAAEKYSRQLSPDDVIVMIFGDSGRAYLSKDYCS